MRELALRNGGVALLDDEDFDRFGAQKWYRDISGYAFRKQCTDGVERRMTLHRLVIAAPLGMNVDHINGNRLDNRRSNLRLCTRVQNRWNSATRKQGKRFKGAYWHSRDKVWRARIVVHGQTYNLGQFKSEEDAARAYDAAAREYCGEFARLNFPDSLQHA